MDTRPPLLYLAHRIPYPPNKGDKVRSFNILRQLARRHRVYLGCFVDHADDEQHVDRLHEWCARTHVVRLDVRRARLASLVGLVSGEALSVPYYRDGGLRAWVRKVVAQHGIRHAVAFSGPMAQYLDIPGLERRIVDFCDVDSAKWMQYAGEHRWPMSWLYRRESRRLLAFERRAARDADASVFVTEGEAAIFRRAAPELADRILAVNNGVDADFFSPEVAHDNPYPAGGPVVLFTGAMDYWPNVDAVRWFVREILPAIHQCHPDVRFYIVGMNPAAAVRALAGPQVFVTGTVPDIRPWLAHADVVAAPLRVARGVQNKILEAMAMARPVVASASSAAGLAARTGIDFETATDAGQFAERIFSLLSNGPGSMRMGASARECVRMHYSWEANLMSFERLLADRPPSGSAVTPTALEAHA